MVEMFETQADIYKALLAGKTLMHSTGRKVSLSKGVLVDDEGWCCGGTADFAFPADWTVFEKPKEYATGWAALHALEKGKRIQTGCIGIRANAGGVFVDQPGRKDNRVASVISFLLRTQFEVIE